MRLINGTDLDTLIKRSGALPPARALAIVRQVASALDAAHSVGVLHRDVKPANILVTNDDFAYLVDFGIANAESEQKLTQMGDVIGTWTYMSPERFSGEVDRVSSRADGYALTCVLFEALTGAPPYSGDRVSLIGAHVSAPIPLASNRVGLPSAIDAVIAKGMAKRPEDRYPTCGDLVRAADAATTGVGQPTMNFTPSTAPHVQAAYPAPRAPAMPPPPGSWDPNVHAMQVNSGPQSPLGGWSAPPREPAPKRRGMWIAIAAAVVLVVALVTSVGVWQLTRDEPVQTDAAAAVDLSALDVGRYDTEPHRIPSTGDKEQGRFAEASRLAEGIANPYEVFPNLSYLYGGPLPDPALAATAISGTGVAVVQPVLEKYGMISAFLVQGFSKRRADFLRDGDGDELIVMLTSFPNPDFASRAAQEMDATDMAVNPNNQQVDIPGYPDAHAHYTPGNVSIAATFARGFVVASIFSVRQDATIVSRMTKSIQTVLDGQAPLMKDVLVSADAALTTLPLDPDSMLSRAFISGDVPPLSAGFMTIGPRAVMVCGNAQETENDLLVDAGVDRCAITSDGLLLRAKDEDAATELRTKAHDAVKVDTVEQDIDPPTGFDGVNCFEAKSEFWADNDNARYQCLLSFGRYYAGVISNEQDDVRQRASAQYALLVNSD
ncbi:DUF7373 family lipoprotein [Mycolicibacterium arenosum]|uniref:non-specific serine/threonine protein kinase n=1 Tax=Mycolicibacterium arenosum TaxID=2952157 RepID=A0ABT1M0R6_9MYCO|nr:serine/threonine-protein kinase [Mycolicibacterium sp. CAU 1645]MCP9272190.1 serine/threonine protein kinase [Mycolicibacterium sp. CAU 1645]